MTVAEKKLVRKRLSALELAERLGNVSEACRRRGVGRTQFYEYKRRFQTHGLEGLVDLPPIHKSHPQTTPSEVVKQILALSLAHLARGCYRLSNHLQLMGVSVSGVTIQKILDKHGMGTRYERLLKLEEKISGDQIELTPEQVAAIEKANPCLKERHVESSAPGQLLCQDTFHVGTFKGVGKLPEHAVVILHNEVLPQYEDWGLEVAAILTDNGREYCGTDSPPYELYLSLNDIEHRKTQVRRPQTNGFVERFNRTVLDEFLRQACRTKIYTSVAALQKDLDVWLKYYNTERPHKGYRNMGKRPIDTVNQFSKTVRKKA